MGNLQKRVLLSLALIIMLFGYSNIYAKKQNSNKEITVGTHDIEPLLYKNEKGNIDGFYNDIILEIAKQSDIKVNYKHGTWVEGLERLKDSTIDLMTTIAFNESRDSFADYHAEPVVTIWGQINAKISSKVSSIFDLQDQKIGVMKGDIAGKNFIKNSKKFEVECEIVEYASFDDVMVAIVNDEVFGGVTPNIYKKSREFSQDVIPTSIYFSPFSIYFAAPQGTNSELLQVIDTYLVKWKHDKSSPYYVIYNKWFGGDQYTVKEMPQWIKILLIFGVGSLLFFILLNFFLKSKVNAQEHTIEESNLKFKAAFDEAFQFIGILDLEGHLLDANKTSLDYIAKELKDVQGKLFWDTPWWENNAAGVTLLKAGIQRAMRGDGHNFETTHPSADGDILYFDFSIKPMYNSQKTFTRLLVEGRDITSVKRINRKLKTFERVIESSTDEIMICNENREIEYINNAFEEKLGYSAEYCLGKTPSIFSSGKHSPAFYNEMWDIINAQGIWNGVIRNKTKQGDIIQEDVTITSLTSEKGKLVGYVSVQRDITEQLLLREHLREAQNMEVVGNLIGGIAHDFNNVLSGIKGPISLLTAIIDSGDLPIEKLQRYVHMISESSKRATNLVGQFSTISNNHDTEYKVTNIIESLSHLQEIVTSSFDKSIELKFDFQVEEAYIEGNKTQVEQVLLNLLINASHALTIMKKDKESWGGEIYVKISKSIPNKHFFTAHPEAKDDIDYWEISVQDTGIGMNKKTQSNIFTPFYTTKKSKLGSGLGLFMCYNIVKKHHGFIDVYSEVGYGTTFQVFIPSIQTDDFNKELLLQINNGQSVNQQREGSILIVDDEEFLRDIAEDMALICGLTSTTAVDGLDGVNKLKTLVSEGNVPTMIILDMVMPHLSGKEALEQIRKIDKNIPVILTSGFGSDSRVLEITKSGDALFIQKPYSIESFKNIVKAVYDKIEGK